jgi:hypothetical protein
MHGWERTEFPRPNLRAVESSVSLWSPFSYAEEVIRLDDGRLVMAGLTFRYWGNSIYLFGMETGVDGAPIRYRSPFTLP